MKKFSLKALGATILTLGLVLAGSTMPAQAATLGSPSVTSTGEIGTSGSNSFPITITATTVTAGARYVVIELPTGWSSRFNGGPTCSFVSITGFSNTGSGCSTLVNQQEITVNASSSIAANTTISVTLNVGAVNVATARDFNVWTEPIGGGQLDDATISLASAPSNYTVTFNANGGLGTMADQSASAATNLTANTFTRSGYTFAGWATSATGTVAYADGASYTFTSSTTLYAVWTPTLATTGFDGLPYLAGGLALAVVGGSLMFIARRRALQ